MIKKTKSCSLVEDKPVGAEAVTALKLAVYAVVSQAAVPVQQKPSCLPLLITVVPEGKVIVTPEAPQFKLVPICGSIAFTSILGNC